MFPSRDIYEFWPPLDQKFRFGLFDQGEIKWVKFPISSTGESISLLEGKGPECFPPLIFTHLSIPLAKNFGLVVLTNGRSNKSNFQNLPMERVFSTGT